MMLGIGVSSITIQHVLARNTVLINSRETYCTTMTKRQFEAVREKIPNAEARATHGRTAVATPPVTAPALSPRRKQNRHKEAREFSSRFMAARRDTPGRRFIQLAPVVYHFMYWYIFGGG